jgi:hypothetical protein
MQEISRFPTQDVGRPQGRESLVDILDRVLDKGVVIAGDIAINLLDIELLTIKVRLLIASADKAKEMGIDWWERDPQLSSKAQRSREPGGRDEQKELERENSRLRRELADLRSRVEDLNGAKTKSSRAAGG